jgi:hypothetical protein
MFPSIAHKIAKENRMNLLTGSGYKSTHSLVSALCADMIF